jgi:hypothetical protein
LEFEYLWKLGSSSAHFLVFCHHTFPVEFFIFVSFGITAYGPIYLARLQGSSFDAPIPKSLGVGQWLLPYSARASVRFYFPSGLPAKAEE